MTVRDAVLKQGNAVVGTFYRGQSAVVEDVNGDWLWVSPNVSGWVRRQDVLSLDEAITYFTNQIRRNPRDDGWYYARATAWEQKGELDIAIADFNEVIRLNPDDAAAYDGRANCWYIKEQYDKAIADYDHSIRLDPNDAIGYRNRGRVWVEKEEYDKAIADFSLAIRLNPRYVYPLVHRGNSWIMKGQYDKALADFNQAVRVDSKFVETYISLARLQASCPDERYRDGKQALQNATEACELTGWKDISALDALARAYAELGDFAHAVEYQTKVLDLREVQPEPGKKDWFKHRLDIYKQHKPYRIEVVSN